MIDLPAASFSDVAWPSGCYFPGGDRIGEGLRIEAVQLAARGNCCRIHQEPLSQLSSGQNEISRRVVAHPVHFPVAVSFFAESADGGIIERQVFFEHNLADISRIDRTQP